MLAILGLALTLLVAVERTVRAQAAGQGTPSASEGQNETAASDHLSDQNPKFEARFESLFDGGSFEGWEHSGNWTIDEGAFYRAKEGGALTYVRSSVPDDFELRFEWKVSPGCNSGIYYRPGQVEYQVLDNIGTPLADDPTSIPAADGSRRILGGSHAKEE